METKPLLYGIIGFIAGGLLVSVIATTQDNQTKSTMKSPTTSEHNQNTTDKLRGLSGDEFDKAFITEMIQHHQGAINMAKLIEANAKHAELKKLGNDIVSAQTREVDVMQNWQKEWGYGSSSLHEAHGL